MEGMGVGQDYGRIFRSSTERRVVSGGKRETVGGDKGRTERVRDCGTTEVLVSRRDFNFPLSIFS